ncbi:MAG: hypothetical protein ACR2PG_06150, partial [Hyphomicrobiaceae bacterium]
SSIRSPQSDRMGMISHIIAGLRLTLQSKGGEELHVLLRLSCSERARATRCHACWSYAAFNGLAGRYSDRVLIFTLFTFTLFAFAVFMVLTFTVLTLIGSLLTFSVLQACSMILYSGRPSSLEEGYLLSCSSSGCTKTRAVRTRAATMSQMS